MKRISYIKLNRNLDYEITRDIADQDNLVFHLEQRTGLCRKLI